MRCSGLQQHRANVLMSTVSCVHQGSTAWRTETNETGQSSKMFKVYPFSDELVGTACGANVGLHSLRATDPLEASEEPARKRRQMREECEDPASSV